MSDPPKSFELPLECDSDFVTQKMQAYKVRPRKDHRGAILISDALPFFFPNFAPPFSVEQVGMEAPACFPPTNENVFALLRVARIIFESQMANDAAA
jgi:hypothetical protein